MAKPFKLAGTPTTNPNGMKESKMTNVPTEELAVNGECDNPTPDHPPAIPWPKAEPLEQNGKPFRVK